MRNNTYQHIQEEIPMFCGLNKYGYKLNINHPFINKIYNRYKKANNLSTRFPLSDSERLDFETATIDYLKKRGLIT